MKTDLKSFLIISADSFFHEAGSFDEKIRKAVAGFDLDHMDRITLISALNEIIKSPQSDEKLESYFNNIGTNIGFENPAMVRWWLQLLVRALLESR